MARRQPGLPDLTDRVAVVTGAASGIGRALVQGLWSRGCHVAAVDTDAAGLAELHDELAASGRPQRVSCHVADVSDRARMLRLPTEVTAAHGAVHLLVNNAGVSHEAAFAQTDLEDFDRLIGINLWGVIHGCHAFLPWLAKADRAYIVNLSSMLGLVAMAGQTAYGTSKFAVRGFSEALAEELRATSIGVTLVHPGAIATDIMRRSTGDDPELLQRLTRWYQRHAMPPARAAARIIRAVERGTPRLLIGPETILGDLLRRVLPVTGNRIMVDAIIRVLGVEDMRAKRIARWRETMLDEPAGPDGSAVGS